MKKFLSILKDNKLDSQEWSIMGLPLGGGEMYRYEEPEALIIPFEEGIEIRVDKYTKKDYLTCNKQIRVSIFICLNLNLSFHLQGK